ncbi:MAG: HAMP domain-containing sensor histidine kinase [Roseiarcus sp.]
MIGVRRRLFWKVYLTLLASLLVAAFLMGAFWWLIGENQRVRWGASHVQLDDWSIPGRDGPPGAVAAATKRLGDELGADISVYDAQGTLAASRGLPIPLAAVADRVGPLAQIMRVDLPDGRAVLARLRPAGLSPRLRILTIVLIVVGGVGLAAFPITARLTRRLEDLRSGVEQWGAGALSLRVDGAGDDEVAVVARTFNASAAKVEELLASQKALLANASHELRSPLARLRLAIELWFANPNAEMQAEIVRNLAESDQLVEEILLASRLDHAGPVAARATRVDLLGLAAEEAARIGAGATCVSDGGDPVEIDGDATLLRRLIRNLLENAAKHGRPPITIAVTRREAMARIVVADAGEGIAPAERERVFEPFYRPAGRAESSGGWGLGLSLVRQIAQRHGGAATCEAAPEGGSRFVVDLAMRRG